MNSKEIFDLIRKKSIYLYIYIYIYRKYKPLYICTGLIRLIRNLQRTASSLKIPYQTDETGTDIKWFIFSVHFSAVGLSNR